MNNLAVITCAKNDVLTEQYGLISEREARGDVYLPTREEIEAACAEIREEWSDREYYSRAGCRPPSYVSDNPDDDYTVPCCKRPDDL